MIIYQTFKHDKILEAINPDKSSETQTYFVKYTLVDQDDDLRGKVITLQLMWEHMPTTGLLCMGEQSLGEAST